MLLKYRLKVFIRGESRIYQSLFRKSLPLFPFSGFLILKKLWMFWNRIVIEQEDTFFMSLLDRFFCSQVKESPRLSISWMNEQLYGMCTWIRTVNIWKYMESLYANVAIQYLAGLYELCDHWQNVHFFLISLFTYKMEMTEHNTEGWHTIQIRGHSAWNSVWQASYD